MITKETTIGEVLRLHPQTVPIFLELGMHCLGCPSSAGESIEEAALVHGRDVESLVNELNEAVAVTANE